MKVGYSAFTKKYEFILLPNITNDYGWAKIHYGIEYCNNFFNSKKRLMRKSLYIKRCCEVLNVPTVLGKNFRDIFLTISHSANAFV